MIDRERRQPEFLELALVACILTRRRAMRYAPPPRGAARGTTAASARRRPLGFRVAAARDGVQWLLAVANAVAFVLLLFVRDERGRSAGSLALNPDRAASVAG